MRLTKPDSGKSFKISGNIVDILNSKVYSGSLHIKNRKIANITKDRKTTINACAVRIFKVGNNSLDNGSCS